MEHHADELQFIEWWERDGRHIDWNRRVDEQRSDIHAPDSLDDLICDDCETFQFRVGVIGEKHVCPQCWGDGGYADQEQLDGYVTGADNRPMYAIVGCGKEKREGMHPARELYASPYFGKKREWAEAFAGEWVILSAEHGLIDPDTEIEFYDTTVEDIAIEPWLDDIQATLDASLDSTQNVWVLAGQRYVYTADNKGQTLRHVLNTATDGPVRYPFEQTTGIGDQMQWLTDCLKYNVVAMPYDLLDGGQQSLTHY